MKVEGRNAVYELLKTNKEIDKILVQKDLKDEASKRLINTIRSHKIKVQLVDKYVIDKESESKRIGKIVNEKRTTTKCNCPFCFRW